MACRRGHIHGLQARAAELAGRSPGAGVALELLPEADAAVGDAGGGVPSPCTTALYFVKGIPTNGSRLSLVLTAQPPRRRGGHGCGARGGAAVRRGGFGLRALQRTAAGAASPLRPPQGGPGPVD